MPYIFALAPELILLETKPDLNHFRDCYRRSSARYDLLRLKLAQRIATLSGETPLEHTDDAVPKYMPTHMGDPFTSAPLKYNAVLKRFYSVGPNGVDDGGATSGDIWLGD